MVCVFVPKASQIALEICGAKVIAGAAGLWCAARPVSPYIRPSFLERHRVGMGCVRVGDTLAVHGDVRCGARVRA